LHKLSRAPWRFSKSDKAAFLKAIETLVTAGHEVRVEIDAQNGKMVVVSGKAKSDKCDEGGKNTWDGI
jgi:hypothetical protein